MYKKVHMKERFNSLRHLEKKHFNSFESHWKTRKVQFFESERKTSTLWVILKKRFMKRGSIRWVKSYFLKKKFNSESHTKKVQYFESYQRKKVESSESYWRISILWVVFKKKSSMSQKSHFQKSSILWVVWKKYSSVSRICTSNKFHFESHSKKKDQFFESFWKNIFKKVQVCESLKIKFFESHVIKKGSILRVILEKSLSHIEKKFSSLYRISGKSSILWVVFVFDKNSKIQFFESH